MGPPGKGAGKAATYGKFTGKKAAGPAPSAAEAAEDWRGEISENGTGGKGKGKFGKFGKIATDRFIPYPMEGHEDAWWRGVGWTEAWFQAEEHCIEVMQRIIEERYGSNEEMP
jgi:hypothetical protein